ncbi:MAG: ABC transporter permease [Streptosporangiaceae bacterium]
MTRLGQAGLLRFAIRRIAVAIPALLGLALVTFALENYLPGNPIVRLLGQHEASKPAVVAAYRHRYGLDRPLPVRFASYIQHLLEGDLGHSFTTQQPVSRDLAAYFPATVELGLAALIITTVAGISAGVLAALTYRRWPDYVLRGIALISSGVPVFWLAVIALQVFYLRLHWFPGPEGRLSADLAPPPHFTGLYTVDALVAGQFGTFWNALWHLILPAAVLGAYFLGLLTRITRASLLDVLSANYLVAARSRGLPPWRIIIRHALPNGLVPILTVFGLAIGGMFAGAVLTESVFDWPGIGLYAVKTAENLDYSAVVGVTLLVGVVYVLSGALIDILYAVVDPRIRSVR